MGIMGAVFAVSSVAGPLLGGWLTEGPGWRWAFWMNIPLGALALLATALFLHLPKPVRDRSARIDYLGMALIGGATAAVVLLCTWGGSTYDWSSPQVIGLITAALVLIAAFVLNERKATTPVIPLSLFTHRNFTIPTFGALLIGVAMFGVISYMPTYIQMVTGVDATIAGLMMAPMMGGMLVTSTLAGFQVSRSGKYKMFPIIGALVMAVGLFLISRLTIDSATWVLCGALLVFGIGLGLGQQILMLIVQDAFPARIVGTATASFNYFKQVGASIGSAVVGSIFASRLTTIMSDKLGAAGTAAQGSGDTSSLTPEFVQQLPDAVRIPIVESYNEALLPIFFAMIPVALVAFAVLFFVTEKPLSTTIERDVEVEDRADGNAAADDPEVLRRSTVADERGKPAAVQDRAGAAGRDEPEAADDEEGLVSASAR
jgi:MFS family permease